MKAKLLLLVCGSLLAGCQTPRPVIKPLPDPLPMREKPANYAEHAPASVTPTVTVSVAPPSARNAEELARQSQVIEALIAQNDALTARLRQLERDGAASNAGAAAIPVPAATPAPPVSAISPTTPPLSASTPSAAPSRAPTDTPATALPPPAPEKPLLTPNADGVIDVTALDPTPPGAPLNPFAVRAPSADAGREITLRVQGIVTGEKPCAIVNDRVVECGQRIESLQLNRLLPDALVLGGDGFDLNLPLGATKVRLF